MQTFDANIANIYTSVTCVLLNGLKMSETKTTLTVRLDVIKRDLVEKAFDKCRELHYLTNKGDALFKITEQWYDIISAEEGTSQEVLTPTTDQLEDLCAVGFLQRIIQPKTNFYLWHCLKNQRLYGKGKPLLMADGKDRLSIQRLCEACKTGFQLHEERSKLGKARAVIQRFGDMKIDAIINCCIHPANNAIQINLGNHGNFYCKKTDDRVTIKGSCGAGQCDYFFKTSAPLYVKETEGFQEVIKQLE